MLEIVSQNSVGWCQSTNAAARFKKEKITSFSKTTLLHKESFLTMFDSINSSPVDFTK